MSRGFSIRNIVLRIFFVGAILWLAALYLVPHFSSLKGGEKREIREDSYGMSRQPILERPDIDRLRFEQAMQKDYAAEQKELQRLKQALIIQEEIARRRAEDRRIPPFKLNFGDQSGSSVTKKQRENILAFFFGGNDKPAQIPEKSGKSDKIEDITEELIKSGLIVPKWNVDVETPENRSAPGELGRAIAISRDDLSAGEKKKFDLGLEQNAFNQYASDMASLHRSLPDMRDSGCKSLKYMEDLPDTSVIIIFHNEAWSTLLRTVHSVLDRSPPHLIRDIILVDDFSDLDHLLKPLDEYMAKLRKVKVVRSKSRQGLIRARLLGASQATGAVLTFLDSHCECTMGWLEPLLDRIAQNWSNVVTPIIDVIDDNTLRYLHNNARSTSVGGFDWNLQFNWHGIPLREMKRRKSDIEPVQSPTMAGGLFAISRNYFEYLGTYDPGMDIWGGENLELSFRIWMCGGALEIIICSHVGHIFRFRSPYKWRTGTNVVRKNSIRLAEVWMDDYKNHYYERFNFELGDYGDVSSRQELRKRLKCKSFDWYLHNIYPEQFIPGEAIASGEIRNKALGVFEGGRSPICLDASVEKEGLNKPVKLWPCHNQGGNQYWMMSKNNEIRRDEGCFDYDGSQIMIYACHNSKGNQEWLYRHDNTLYQPTHDKCIELSEDGLSISMQRCSDIDRQIWVWKRKSDSLNNATISI